MFPSCVLWWCSNVEGSGWHVELVIDLAGAVEPLVAKAWNVDIATPIIAKFYMTCVYVFE